MHNQDLWMNCRLVGDRLAHWPLNCFLGKIVQKQETYFISEEARRRMFCIPKNATIMMFFSTFRYHAIT